MSGSAAFVEPSWASVFALHGLRTFDDFWNLGGEQVESGNSARGGCSHVARAVLPAEQGAEREIYIKRQENFWSRTFAHPLRGVPLAQREFDALQRLQRVGIPAPQPLYFSTQVAGAKTRAILVTAALRGYVSLEDLQRQRSATSRRKIVTLTAGLLQAIHRHGWRHNCFYPKHVFFRFAGGGEADACVIDLEKLRRRRPGLMGGFRDLRTFLKRCPEWSRADQLRFIHTYLGVTRSDQRARRLWAALKRAGI